jgi:hypothetical protein
MNQSITLSQISDFFERFKHFKLADVERLDQQKLAEAEQFIARFNAFKPLYEEAREAAEISKRKFAPRFNIFQWLGKDRLEEFHSDFIAYLLNPRESHGQGHLFLLTFFQSLSPHYPALKLPDEPLNHGSWLVEREVFTRFGNLDIVLSNPALRALYVIENKIDAGEQSGQLYRYLKYLKSTDYRFQGLLFLTLDGHPGTTDEDKLHHPISYHTHIRDWLNGTLEQIEALTVRETVRQYLDLIQGL